MTVEYVCFLTSYLDTTRILFGDSWRIAYSHGVHALFSSCGLTSKRSLRIFAQISKWWGVHAIRWTGHDSHASSSTDITLSTSNNLYTYKIHTFFCVLIFSFSSCKSVVELMPHPVQGAFDSTTFAAIQETLESRDIGRTVIRWTVNMLKCRNIHLTYQSESVEMRVVKGCPQEGVFSPLLWCMVVHSQFLKLNAVGVYSTSLCRRPGDCDLG